MIVFASWKEPIRRRSVPDPGPEPPGAQQGFYVHGSLRVERPSFRSSEVEGIRRGQVRHPNQIVSEVLLDEASSLLQKSSYRVNLRLVFLKRSGPEQEVGAAVQSLLQSAERLDIVEDTASHFLNTVD